MLFYHSFHPILFIFIFMTRGAVILHGVTWKIVYRKLGGERQGHWKEYRRLNGIYISSSIRQKMVAGSRVFMRVLYRLDGYCYGRCLFSPFIFFPFLFPLAIFLWRVAKSITR